MWEWGGKDWGVVCLKYLFWFREVKILRVYLNRFGRKNV